MVLLARHYIISSAKQKASETLLEPPAKLVRSEKTSATDMLAKNIS